MVLEKVEGLKSQRGFFLPFQAVQAHRFAFTLYFYPYTVNISEYILFGVGLRE